MSQQATPNVVNPRHLNVLRRLLCVEADCGKPAESVWQEEGRLSERQLCGGFKHRDNPLIEPFEVTGHYGDAFREECGEQSKRTGMQLLIDERKKRHAQYMQELKDQKEAERK